MTVLPEKIRGQRLILVGLIISFVSFCAKVMSDHAGGGDRWRQGDWLVNSENGPVRRAVSGDLMLWLSDLFQVSPVLTVAVTQTLICLVLFCLVAKILLEDKKGFASLIALSSSFIIFGYIADPNGIGRKELISFTSLALTAIALNKKNPYLLAFGLLIFPLAVIIHEAMILFLPVLVGAYLISFPDIKSWRGVHVVFGVSVLVSVSAFLHGMLNSMSSDPALVCEPLLRRGLGPEMCNGAIEWLGKDFQGGVQSVVDRLRIRLFLELAIGYGLALAPALYLVLLSRKKVLNLAVLILVGLPFMPLYLVAIDYGRWITFHLFSIFFVYAINKNTEFLGLEGKIDGRVFWGLAVVSALISHKHMHFIYWGGAVRQLVSGLPGAG